MANAISSTPSIHLKCQTKFMHALDDILDESFKIECSFSFPQFVYCSRDEVYFLKLSSLIASDGSTLNGQHTTVAMHHIQDITKPLMMLLLHYDVTSPWLLRRCFKQGFRDHRKQPIYEFNWIVISIGIQLIKTAKSNGWNNHTLCL